MLWLLAAVVIFHMCIILNFIPYEITWGGRLKNKSEMYVFETISIVINLMLMFSLLIKGEYIKTFVSIKTVNVVLWIFLVLFGLNTIGNILAKTTFEKFFAILTFGFTLLLLSILTKQKKSLDL